MLTEKERLRKMRFDRQGGKCLYCGCAMDLSTLTNANSCTLDHFFPIASGGSRRGRNVVAACFACNQAKGRLDPIDFMAGKQPRRKRTFDPFLWRA